jgi:hypothetical protein
MNAFRNYEVIIPKFKSWDKGIRVKVNEKFSLYNLSKPGSWMWRDDSPYWGVCLTSELEKRFVFPFTNDMSWEEGLDFCKKYFKK